MKTENLEKAKAFFDKNVDVAKVYFTSDGNIFRVKQYADNWSVALSDKAVIEVSRAETLADAKTEPTDGANANGNDVGSDKKGGDKKTDAGENKGDDEKAELVKRYIELYDTKPNHMTGIPKLKEAIAAKEAELKAASEKEA